MDTKHDIPHREIGEQDDELLEQLWKQLPDSQEDPFIADQGFKDLQGRIQRKLRIKRRFRILTAGSIAAALITGVLIFRTLIPSEQVSTAIAQLQDMGVTISVILFPDQQVSFDCVSGDMKVAQVDASAFAAWKDGWIYFEDETLPDLAKRLSRVYGVEIKVAERLRNYSFSGKISYERGVDYITRLMEETNGVVCEVENGVLWLR